MTMCRHCGYAGSACDCVDRRAQPEPAASADPSRDAYEGCREDLLGWKRRALKAEETCRQLTRALGEDVNGTTFMGEPVLPPRDAAPSVAPEPGALTVAAVRALPTIYSSEIDGEESDGTPRYWRDRPFVSRTKLERLIASAHSPRPEPAQMSDALALAYKALLVNRALMRQLVLAGAREYRYFHARDGSMVEAMGPINATDEALVAVMDALPRSTEGPAK